MTTDGTGATSSDIVEGATFVVAKLSIHRRAHSVQPVVGMASHTLCGRLTELAAANGRISPDGRTPRPQCVHREGPDA